MKILIIVILVLLVLIIAASIALASFTMTGSRQTLEEAFAWQSDHYDTSFYSALEKEDYTVSGHDDYVIHVEFLKNPDSDGKYIILSHGYTDNRFGSLKYAKMYLDLGFNCIIYDLRGHGENEKTFTSYGVLESKDLIKLIEDTGSRYSDIKTLGLHGESLGAATTVTSMKYKPDVDFAVADCGFSDIENVLKNGYASVNAPSFLFNLSNLGAMILYHHSLSSMRPIDSLDDNQVPILFIHGAEDSFIVPDNSRNMSERTAGYSELHLVEGAGHAESILTDPDSYMKYVEAFLKKVL
ncbi:MAG: alpha/beta hydrolase [Lachnospiraceae bacterium]|nr:alpha/beta hydrolase [Lachnospiraceae bacterium]